MKSANYILIFFLGIIIPGCQDTGIVDNSTEFIEYLVVRAELKANTNFEGVQITKTLPLEETYDITKAEIKNAVVHLKVNGFQIIPLHYVNNGIYKSIYNVKIVPGFNYELFAEVGEKSVYGNTRVPEIPQVNNASFDNNIYLTAEVVSKPSEVYGADWVIIRNPSDPPETSDNYFSIVPVEFKPTEPSIALRTIEVPENLRTPVFRNSTYIKVTAFDHSFLDYFKTRNNNNPINNVFLSGGGAVGWNVQGEKVIGIFIGIAEGNLILP
jgi:hypothetical protein